MYALASVEAGGLQDPEILEFVARVLLLALTVMGGGGDLVDEVAEGYG